MILDIDFASNILRGRAFFSKKLRSPKTERIDVSRYKTRRHALSSQAPGSTPSSVASWPVALSVWIDSLSSIMGRST